jgi:hypothetical protein
MYTGRIALFTTSALLLGLVGGSLFTLRVFADESEGASDCPERAFGLYCPDDPSPVDNPNLDCPERAFGLYCPDDPSPEENPNLPSPSPTPTPTPTPDSSGGDGGGGGSSGGGGGGGDGGGGGGGSEEQTPTPAKNVVKKGAVKGAKVARVSSFDPKKLNALFRSVYGRNPTPSENRYWLSRLKDKKTETLLRGAMQWHRAHGIRH